MEIKIILLKLKAAKLPVNFFNLLIPSKKADRKFSAFEKSARKRKRRGSGVGDQGGAIKTFSVLLFMKKQMWKERMLLATTIKIC